jgi:hypothetical protein
MKYEVMKQWTEALRSGKYKQGKRWLHQPEPKNEFCCLGVLCDISELSTWSIYGTYACSSVSLPSPVKEWAGLKTNEGNFNNRWERYWSLTYLNDSGKSFEEIADIIEENWEEL